MQVYDETEPDSADKPVLGEKGRRYSKVNWMKGAFLSADKLLTVSPTYAEEIAANESQGVELDNVIRYCGLEPVGSLSAHWCPCHSQYPLPLRLHSVFSSASVSCYSKQQGTNDVPTLTCAYSAENHEGIGRQHGKAQLIVPTRISRERTSH